MPALTGEVVIENGILLNNNIIREKTENVVPTVYN